MPSPFRSSNRSTRPTSRTSQLERVAAYCSVHSVMITLFAITVAVLSAWATISAGYLLGAVDGQYRHAVLLVHLFGVCPAVMVAPAIKTESERRMAWVFLAVDAAIMVVGSCIVEAVSWANV